MNVKVNFLEQFVIYPEPSFGMDELSKNIV